MNSAIRWKRGVESYIHFVPEELESIQEKTKKGFGSLPETFFKNRTYNPE
jgi:hypothetical protein